MSERDTYPIGASLRLGSELEVATLIPQAAAQVNHMMLPRNILHGIYQNTVVGGLRSVGICDSAEVFCRHLLERPNSLSFPFTAKIAQRGCRSQE